MSLVNHVDTTELECVSKASFLFIFQKLCYKLVFNSWVQTTLTKEDDLYVTIVDLSTHNNKFLFINLPSYFTFIRG
ncbi:hypothetical protein Hanom_Chr04g00301991 [Helianthus anomalus]